MAATGQKISVEDPRNQHSKKRSEANIPAVFGRNQSSMLPNSRERPGHKQTVAASGGKSYRNELEPKEREVSSRSNCRRKVVTATKETTGISEEGES